MESTSARRCGLDDTLWHAIMCHAAGRAAEALQIVEQEEGTACADGVRAVVLAGAGCWGEASRSIRSADESGGSTAGAIVAWARGLLASGRGKPSIALVELERAAASLPDGPESALGVAVRLERLELATASGASLDGDAAWLAQQFDARPPVLGAWAKLVAGLATLENRGGAAARDELESIARWAERQAWPRIQARALLAAARAAEGDGDDAAARVHRATALEVLEAQAMALPPQLRAQFWSVPAHRVARRVPEPQIGREPEPSFHRPGLEARTARLLDILERLVGELDLERLLERIVDSAVELTGAERGFLLLVDGEGGLEPAPRVARSRTVGPDDPSVPFSRSIAEAVLIDGEAIVAVDAGADRRLDEYLSVHQLKLQSVACVPVGNPEGIEGVLYLEHRLRKGRFGDTELSLLLAFANQAALALQKAKLIAEDRRRRGELEDANRQLRQAKSDLEHVLAARTAELEDARQELDRARGAPSAPDYERHGMVGRSEALRRVFAVIDRVRETYVPVVVRGESGTGKELVARAVHYAGARAEGPFVVVNCAAIPEALLESELFGHVRGAFTGADRDRKGVMVRASGGTLFLDEVGDMPPKMQVELLRVLVDGKVRPVGGEREEAVDVRIVAATQRPLRDLVEEGRFREDLFYRLDVVEIRMPPLRERPEDIPLLADHFLKGFADREGVGRKRLTRDALESLCAQRWPGNVRQLEHVLLNACVLAESDEIDADGLALDSREATGVVAPVAIPAVSGSAVPAPASLDDFKAMERQRILDALHEHGWNRARAARALGIPRRTFYRRLQEHDIQ